MPHQSQQKVRRPQAIARAQKLKGKTQGRRALQGIAEVVQARQGQRPQAQAVRGQRTQLSQQATKVRPEAAARQSRLKLKTAGRQQSQALQSQLAQVGK